MTSLHEPGARSPPETSRVSVSLVQLGRASPISVLAPSDARHSVLGLLSLLTCSIMKVLRVPTCWNPASGCSDVRPLHFLSPQSHHGIPKVPRWVRKRTGGSGRAPK